MSREDDSLIDLALAISDGAPIDWAAPPAAGTSESDTKVLRHLRVIAEIVTLHQRLGSSMHLSVIDELENASRSPDTREALPSWGPLRLIDRVGEGVFGEVYRAWDSRLDREVALKLLRRRESQRAAGSSLIEEGRLLAKVRHPNVVTVYGAERIGEHVGIWMEFVEGSTLAQVVASEGQLPSEDVIRIGRDLAGALAAVHRAGLLHRDIKAQNVMRDGDGRLVLMDFGAGRDRLTASGMAGTPLYLAPEVLNGQPATVQSDIYSVGVLLYFAASGAFPVAGRSLDEIRQAHAQGKAVPLGAIRPDLPNSFLRLVDRATAPNPADRFDSASEMKGAFAALTRPRRRQPILAASLALAATLGVGLAVGIPLMRQPDRAVLTGDSDRSVVTRRLSAKAGIEAFSGVSSNGRLIVHVDDESEDLAVLDLTTGSRRVLTQNRSSAQSTDYAEASALSPDDRWIAYVWWSHDEAAYQLRLIGVEGGTPQVLYRNEQMAYIAAVDWLPDGSGVVASLGMNDGITQLAIIPTSGGTARVLTRYEGRAPWKIAVSPDGRFVAWDVPARAEEPQRDIRLVSVDGRLETVVVQHPSDDFVIGWMPDGHRLVFGTDRTTGSPSIWSVAIKDGAAAGAPELLRLDAGRTWPLRITPIGSYIYGVPISIEDVYIGRLDGAMHRIDTSRVPVSTSFVGANRWPEWSHDGREIAYVAQSRLGVARAPLALTIQSLETGSQRQLALPINEFLRLRWSPDGRSILGVGRDHRGRGGIYQVDLTSGTTRAILTVPLGLPRQVDWAPDRKSIFYSAPTTAGVTRFELGTGRTTDVLRGMYSFAASPDGRWLAGNVDDEQSGVARLILAPIDGGQPRELAREEGLGAFSMGCTWAADSQRILCIRRTSAISRSELWRFSIAGTAERLAATNDMRHIRLHPDGRRLAFVAGSFTSEIWMMENLLPPAR